VHPETKKEMIFDEPLPNDMESVIDKWRDYAQHKKLQ
jgi:23S rRNA pseudouridine1911/1915/1917 synthase